VRKMIKPGAQEAQGQAPERPGIPAADTGDQSGSWDFGHDRRVSMTDDQLRALALRLIEVPGIVGVLLGGSRARGEHEPASDVDLGLYYEFSLDVAVLGDLLREVAGEGAKVTQLGEWGPWVDGGAWLTLSGYALDWIYRDLNRVRGEWDDAKEGRYRFNAQIGHPLGVPDFAYAGGVALGVILADPSGQLTELQTTTSHYPPALGDALINGLWEASFAVELARKAASRSDTAYVAGCLFRALELCAHALYGRDGRWLINEKGAVASAAQLSCSDYAFPAGARRGPLRRTSGPIGSRWRVCRPGPPFPGSACLGRHDTPRIAWGTLRRWQRSEQVDGPAVGIMDHGITHAPERIPGLKVAVVAGVS
jgi:predicted nucleotidyltransferase